MSQIQEFVETGPHVAAIQHDGTQETAEEIQKWVSSPLKADILPRGEHNHDEVNVYLAIQSLYSVVYIGPGDWVIDKDGYITVQHNDEFVKSHKEVTKPMGNLIDHAKRELELLGEEPDVVDWYLEVVHAFASFGHSGGSAAATIPVITALLQYQNLSPLTDDPDEWEHISDEVWGEKGGAWQSKRNPAAFSRDHGKTYYFVTEGSKKKHMHKTEAYKK